MQTSLQGFMENFQTNCGVNVHVNFHASLNVTFHANSHASLNVMFYANSHANLSAMFLANFNSEVVKCEVSLWDMGYPNIRPRPFRVGPWIASLSWV